MVCPKCGRKNSDGCTVCKICGSDISDDSPFIWSELIPMPDFNRANSETREEANGAGSRFFGRKINRNIISIFAVFMEICILAGVIFGICVWKLDSISSNSSVPQNIVYSSEDIVMMLVKNREEWILPKPDNGYNSCSFIDMDFDGSPELISISFDSESGVTQVKAFRIRSCILENIPIDYNETEGFFDIWKNISLKYDPDTKELLYFSSDYKKDDNGNTTELGSFFILENCIYRKMYLSERINNGVFSYFGYDEEQSAVELTKQEFMKKQNELSGHFADLHLRYEWLQGNDLENLSSQKLAALLLRSYDSFGYDSTGLALQ